MVIYSIFQELRIGCWWREAEWAGPREEAHLCTPTQCARLDVLSTGTRGFIFHSFLFLHLTNYEYCHGLRYLQEEHNLRTFSTWHVFFLLSSRLLFSSSIYQPASMVDWCSIRSAGKRVVLDSGESTVLFLNHFLFSFILIIWEGRLPQWAERTCLLPM